MSVEKAFSEFSEVISKLNEAGEITLSVSVEESARKGILLAAASEFEHQLCGIVRDFAARCSNNDPMIASLVEKKAISRQYHTWFDWNKKSANTFYSMFGEAYLDTMKEKRRQDDEFAGALSSFLELGQLRNLLVHNNYAAFYIEKTLGELYTEYGKARHFVSSIRESLS